LYSRAASESGVAGGDPVVGLVQHVAGGAAAVVADAVEVEHLAGAGVAVGGFGEVGGDARGVDVVVDVVGGEVGEDFAAVGRLPPKEAEGKLVGVVPVHFLRDEVVEAGALVDLGCLPVVAEGVGVP